MIATDQRLFLRRLGAAVAVAFVVSASIVSSSPVLADAEPDPDPVETIIAARNQANRFAEDVFAVESDLDGLELSEQRLQTEVDELEADVATLKKSAETIAIDVYTGRSDPGIPALTEGRAPIERITEEVLAGFVNGDIDLDVDEFENSVASLNKSRAELAALRTKTERRRKDLEAALSDALAQIEVLRGLEADYLADEATEDAVQAAWAAEQRSDDAEQREQQIAAERELVPSLAAATTPPQDVRESQADQPRGENPDGAIADDDEAAIASEIEADAFGYVEGSAAVDVNGDVTGGRAANGASLAGRTGRGGTGSDGEAPPPPPPPPPAVFVCPVGGPSSYADTWGAPRSGGRTHQGVDMLAAFGTPLVAVVPGQVVYRYNKLGGSTATLYGDDGNRYYYAHLSRSEGSARRLAQADVIGYVGDSGNATGIPHLHFEIHPGGGVAVNPYPTVRGVGC